MIFASVIRCHRGVTSETSWCQHTQHTAKRQCSGSSGGSGQLRAHPCPSLLPKLGQTSSADAREWKGNGRVCAYLFSSTPPHK